MWAWKAEWHNCYLNHNVVMSFYPEGLNLYCCFKFHAINNNFIEKNSSIHGKHSIIDQKSIHVLEVHISTKIMSLTMLNVYINDLKRV